MRRRIPSVPQKTGSPKSMHPLLADCKFLVHWKEHFFIRKGSNKP